MSQRSWLSYTTFILFAALNVDVGSVHARTSQSHRQSTPRYLDQYLRAKQGIDAEERELQARLHAEISTDFKHLDGDSGMMTLHHKSEKHDAHKKAVAELRRHILSKRKDKANSVAVRQGLRVKRLAHYRIVKTARAKKAAEIISRKSSDSTPVKSGKGIPVPPPHFDINTVHRFDPGQSLSFARELFETFALSYADTSLMTGYVGRDIVQLGAKSVR